MVARVRDEGRLLGKAGGKTGGVRRAWGYERHGGMRGMGGGDEEGVGIGIGRMWGGRGTLRIMWKGGGG